MDSHDLAAYLTQEGFVVRSISTVDPLANTLDKRPVEVAKSLAIIRTPISKGITGVPKCRFCGKSFANSIALRNHSKNEHFDLINEEFDRFEASLGDENVNGDQSESSLPVGSQYQVVDSSFISDGTCDASDEVSYVVIKTPVLGSSMGPMRKARKVETRPRKPYENRSRSESRDVKLVEFGGPFSCVRCAEVFTDCCEYSQHFHNAHSKRKRLTRCQICEKRFDQELDSQLGVFLYPEDDQPVCVVCSICSERFPTALQLEAHHKAAHSKLKPFQCSLCPKTFSQGNGLSQHMKIHSGVRPYGCTACGKSFTQKSGLEQHARTHSARRPYACVVCARGFRQAAHLAQHVRTHTRVRPFRCPRCPRAFKQATHLNFHARAHHAADGGEEQA